MTKLGAVVAAAVLVLSIAAPAQSAQRAWTFLGQRSVTDRADHDVIPVTGDRGTFKQIKLSVQRASVDFRRVVVHYGNGGHEEIDIKSTIRAGGETRAINLNGEDRVIKSVEFWYDANTRRGRQAVVRLFGKD
jgi:hypothetical protein